MKLYCHYCLSLKLIILDGICNYCKIMFVDEFYKIVY